MPNRDIIVIGASAGGLEALQRLVAGLPQVFPATIFVVWHMPAHGLGILPDVLQRAGPLPAVHPQDGAKVYPGQIYVAPPDRHLLLEDGQVRLTRGPKENHFRPAVDPLFRSAAYSYGARTIGIVLTGALDDGTAGLWTIKDYGGLAIVQDPQEAMFPSMPESALEHVEIDYVRPVAQIGPLLVELTQQSVERGGSSMSKELKIEHRIALADNALESGVMELGPPSPYTCPECHGTLMQYTTGGLVRFRCHTGHAFSATGLAANVKDSVEESLWNALRAIEESVMLLRQLADQSRATGHHQDAQRFLEQCLAAEQQSQIVRQAVMHYDQPGPRQPVSDQSGDMHGS